MFYELSAAYGRDYKTAKAVKAAFHAGMDFEGDFNFGFKPVNKSDISVGSTVNLRYNGNVSVAVVKVTDHVLVAESPVVKKPKSPSIGTMNRWMNDGVAKATDGCRVEPDGHCEHGKPSWLIELGLI